MKTSLCLIATTIQKTMYSRLDENLKDCHKSTTSTVPIDSGNDSGSSRWRQDASHTRKLEQFNDHMPTYTAIPVLQRAILAKSLLSCSECRIVLYAVCQCPERLPPSNCRPTAGHRLRCRTPTPDGDAVSFKVPQVPAVRVFSGRAATRSRVRLSSCYFRTQTSVFPPIESSSPWGTKRYENAIGSSSAPEIVNVIKSSATASFPRSSSVPSSDVIANVPRAESTTRVSAPQSGT